MTVPVTAGTTYHIQLAGWNNTVAANILLNWSFVPAIRAEIEAFGPGATISPVVANAATIAWTVPYGSDLATLSPTFELSPGATCTVASIPAVSGETRDFTSPVKYTVTSSNSAITNVYTVTVTVGPAPPGGVTDLVLWLDASAPDTMTVAGTTVNEWRDKLDSAAKMTRQAGAPTVVATGIGGIPTVRFDTSSRMNDGVNHAAPVTIFYVSRQTGGANGRVLTSSGNNWLLGYWSGRRGSAYFDGDVRLGGDGVGSSDTAPHLYATTIPGSGSDSTVWAEGLQIASNQGGVTGPNNLQLNGLSSGGGNEPSNCDISEVLVYNRILAPDELDKVGVYLTLKYSLPTSYGNELTIMLTSPANEQVYPSGTPISAIAGVVSGTAPRTVKFFTRSLPDGTFAEAIADLTTPPYTYTVNLGTLSVGSYEIYATVTDSATPTPVTATSATNTFAVAPATPTTTTVVSSGTPSIYGDSVTFTATVAPVPSGGTVQFYDGASALGGAVLVNTATGVAQISVTTLGVGTRNITAAYRGYQSYEASTSAVLTHVVNKAGLTVTALDMFRLPKTANPTFFYDVTGFKNGENLGTSGVTGTPALTTDAVLSSPVGEYTIYCAVGSLAAANYSFVTFVNGILTVADVADTFSVNFYSFGNLPPASQANVLMTPGLPAGLGHWFTPGWYNQVVPWGGGLQPAVELTSNKGSSSTFLFKDCRNGWQSWGEPRTTNLGVGNYNMMGSGVNSTLDPMSDPAKFDMEVTNIPFRTGYDVIFYFRANDAQYGDGTGVIVFNGGTERAFKLQSGAFNGSFTEMVDETTPGNYIVFTGVTGDSFTVQTWGTGPTGFNHLGPAGFQIRNAPLPATITSFGTNVVGSSAVIGLPVAGVATIDWSLPYGTSLVTLAPTFTLSSGVCTDQTSGVIPSPNFSAGPVTYTVTDNTTDPDTTTVYTVTATVRQGFAVTYKSNGSTGGTAPVDNSPYLIGATVTVLDNIDLVKTGYTFAGWNTQADGLGTSYAPNATFNITADTTLYARWLSSAKDILTCDVGGTSVSAFKYDNIYLKVAAGTSVTALPVNYTVSPGASGAPPSGTPRDFTTPQTYTITAQDGSTTNYTVTVIVDGPPVLIGHWASGAESLADSSGYTPAGTHDGVAMGDNAGLLAWSSDVPVGFTGKSLDLSAGSVAVQIDNTATNDSAYRTTFDQGIGTKFTTTFWFKGPVDTLTGVWVSKSGNTPYGWKARPLNGTLPVVNVDFTMRDNTGDAPTPSALQTSGVSVNDGAWHHVAEVLDGWNPSFRKVYVDGVLRAQSTGTNNPVNIANLSHLLLGATQGQSPQVPDATIGVPGGFFTGQLYGVRIYNGPLTAAEVDSVYSRRPILTGITGPGPAGFTLQGSTAYAGDLVTMKATSLSPSNWTPVQTNAVPIGSFSITLPQGADPHAFYRLMVP
jgi:uncharacterized repeat protein (TIGR02543 family)